MHLEIKHYTEVDRETWNNFVYSSSMGWAYFLYDMVSYLWNDKEKNLTFAIVDENNNIYMMVLLRETLKHTLESRWGFIIKDDLTKKQSKALKQTFLDYIDAYIEKHKIKEFNINISPLNDANLPEKHNCINPTMFWGFKPSIKYTYVVDLSKPFDRMLADCEETTRQAIRKLEKSSLYEIIESKGSNEDCDIYIKLHKETFIRTKDTKAIMSDEYHRNIFENLIPQNICKVYFLKNKETNEYIATIAILIYKKTAYYWWGGSTNEKDNGINKYLLFKAMCEIRTLFGESGYFETGGANVFLREGKYKGLNDFKKCFGTFLHPIFKGTYYVVKHRYPRFVRENYKIIRTKLYEIFNK